MPRGLSAAKPDLKAAIESAFNQYVQAGSVKGNNPASNASALADAIANAVHSFVRSAKVQADIGSGGVITSNFKDGVPAVGGIPIVANTPGAPIVTRPGEGKLS